MPEGPEVLFHYCMMRKFLKSHQLINIISYSKNPINIPVDLLNDKPILTPDSIDVKGKLLWICLKNASSEYYLHIHFMLSGWFYYDIIPDKMSNVKFILEFAKVKTNKKIKLYLYDNTKLSSLNFLTVLEHNEAINNLGMDIFDSSFTLDYFQKELSLKKIILRNFLTNGKNFSGIGNYIINEVFYMCKFNVRILTTELSKQNIKTLYKKILFIAYSRFFEAINQVENLHLEKYINPDKLINKPKKILIPYEFNIYGLTQTINSEPVIKEKIGGKITYYIKELA